MSGFQDTCDRLGVSARRIRSVAIGDSLYKDLWEVTNADHYSLSDAEVVNLIVDACLHLVTLEVQLEARHTYLNKGSFPPTQVPVGSGQRGARMLRTQSTAPSVYGSMPQEVAENIEIRKLEGSCDRFLDQARPASPQWSPHRRRAGSPQRNSQRPSTEPAQRNPLRPKSAGNARAAKPSRASKVKENAQHHGKQYYYHNNAEYLRSTSQAQMAQERATSPTRRWYTQ
mmetsp:Transcript_97526/g.154300  ORF Transcript_97526/g.154300 Transcript_97526/m.154300 type:complete len:228 (+) Transcript_97526:134-817(+)